MSDFVKSQECVGDACLNFELASERFLTLNGRRGRRQNERIKTFSEVCARTKNLSTDIIILILARLVTALEAFLSQ